MTNEQTKATVATPSAAYEVPKLKAPTPNPPHGGVELDTSLTSLGWLQNMSIGAGPSGFGAAKIMGHQVERRKVYRTGPSSARPPHPKSAPVVKSSGGAQQHSSQRPNSAPGSRTTQHDQLQPNASSYNRKHQEKQQPPMQRPVAGDKPGATATQTTTLTAAAPPQRSGKDGSEHQRPPYTYAVLVHMALNEFEDRSGSLNEIGQWLIKRYPFFEKKNGNSNWIEVIKSNLKAIGHATYNTETDKWALLPEYSDFYKSPNAIKKRGAKPPKKQNKMRSPSLSSLDSCSEGDVRWSAAGNLQLSKSQSALVAPKGKQPKTKGKKRSNSVNYQSVATLMPKGSADSLYRSGSLTLPNATADVIANILQRRDGPVDQFDWASMIKLNVADAPLMSDILAPTSQAPTVGVVSEVMSDMQDGVFDELPSVLTDMEMETSISGMLNASGGMNDLSAMNENFEPLMDSNLLTSDWTVAF